MWCRGGVRKSTRTDGRTHINMIFARGSDFEDKKGDLVNRKIDLSYPESGLTLVLLVTFLDYSPTL